MNPRQIFPASPNAACVDIPIYLFNQVGTAIYPLLVIADAIAPKDGQPPITIATQAVGIGGTGMYAWLSWQPNSAAGLGLGFNNTIPEGAFEMYRHEDGVWAAISEPPRPILILGRALLWRCTGVTNMPELASWIVRTSREPPPIFDGLTCPSVARNADFPRIRPSPLRALSLLGRGPPCPPTQSLLLDNAYRDKFTFTHTTSKEPSPSKRVTFKLPGDPETLVTRRPQYGTICGPESTAIARKAIRRPLIASTDVIEISDDEDEPIAQPSKCKAKACKPPSADAKITSISD